MKPSERPTSLSDKSKIKLALKKSQARKEKK